MPATPRGIRPRNRGEEEIAVFDALPIAADVATLDERV
jgi:hypothetical protein